MSEYIIQETLYSTSFMSSPTSCWGHNYTYEFKIDRLGNIYVKYGIAQYSDPQPIPNTDKFSIVDNIKIPDSFIEMIKIIMPKGKPGNTAHRLELMDLFFNTITNLKQSIKKENNVLESIVDSYTNKINLLEKDIVSLTNKNNELLDKILKLEKENQQMSQLLSVELR